MIADSYNENSRVEPPRCGTADTGRYAFRDIAAGSRRGQNFVLAYNSWAEFTASPAGAHTCAGKSE